MKNVRFNQIGTIDCDIDHEIYGEIPTTLDAVASQEVIDSGVEIAPYIAPVKANDELIADLDAELSALDATPRMLSSALTGDQWAIDKLKDIEVAQAALRNERLALSILG